MALITNQSKNELSGLGLFFKEIVQSRRFVGAAAPSGPILGKAMASKVPKLDEGKVVVELGAGTGAISCSKAVLKGISLFQWSGPMPCPSTS